MKRQRMLETVYAGSDDVVAREIEGELIIIRVNNGAGDMENELFTLNATGQAIWQRLDGCKTLKAVVADLAVEFNAPSREIEKDVMDLVEKLQKSRLLVEVSAA